MKVIDVSLDLCVDLAFVKKRYSEDILKVYYPIEGVIVKFNVLINLNIS